MVRVAVGGPLAVAVELVVGDADAVAGLFAEDKMLSADERGGDVVDPDKIGVIDGEGITTPDGVRVEVGNVDVLDDDVLGAAHDTETLAFDEALATNTDEGLVGSNGDTENTSLVVLDGGGGGVGLVVLAPVVLVDGGLALGSGTPGETSGLGGGTLGADEVEGSVKIDDAGRGVAEVGDELGVGLGVDGRTTLTTGSRGGEALGGGGEGGEGRGDDGRKGGESAEETHG